MLGLSRTTTLMLTTLVPLALSRGEVVVTVNPADSPTSFEVLGGGSISWSPPGAIQLTTTPPPYPDPMKWSHSRGAAHGEPGGFGDTGWNVIGANIHGDAPLVRFDVGGLNARFVQAVYARVFTNDGIFPNHSRQAYGSRLGLAPDALNLYNYAAGGVVLAVGEFAPHGVGLYEIREFLIGYTLATDGDVAVFMDDEVGGGYTANLAGLRIAPSSRVGDANADDYVTPADYTVWADNFGAGPGATLLDGDFSLDGFVDGADYTLWADNYTGRTDEGAVAVPEPSHLALVLLLLALVLRMAHRRVRGSSMCLAALLATIGCCCGATSASELPFVDSPIDAWSLFSTVGAGLGNSTTAEPGPMNAVDPNFLGYVSDSLVASSPVFGAADEDTVRLFRALATSDQHRQLPVFLGGDDGVALYVNGSRIAGGGFGFTFQGEIELQQGANLLEVYHYNGPGGAVVHFSQAPYQGPPIGMAAGVSLRAFGSQLPGDANSDGLVTPADYTIWADNFGLWGGNATFSVGDFNLNGFVDGADYTLWSDNYTGLPGGATVPATTAVPEPASMLFALFAACGLAIVAHNKRTSCV